ncbi:MAG: type II toxin-antitoxin system RelE/ParE family toxin [Bifidobacteriaceae bacterium]|nr:type II toxin-antitoxin system RelE/ParE family toxin [Bifidobacteriaceae bacterium]
MEIEIKHDAEKYLSKLPKTDSNRILDAIEGLMEKPMVGDIQRLKGKNGDCRLRIGKYRVVFLQKGENAIYVSHIDTRGQVYK